MVQRPWIVNRPEICDCRSSPESEFMEVQLADQDGACLLQTHDDFGVFRRNAILEYTARRRGFDAGSIDIVFQRDRNAMKRTAPLATFLFAFHLARRRKRLVPRDSDECIQGRVVLIDSL